MSAPIYRVEDRFPEFPCWVGDTTEALNGRISWHECLSYEQWEDYLWACRFWWKAQTIEDLLPEEATVNDVPTS